MNIGVLTNPGSWYFQDLQRAAQQVSGSQPVSIQALDFAQLSTRLKSSGEIVSCESQSLHAFDAVLVRTMPLGSLEQMIFRMDALAQLHHAGTLVVNPPRSLEIAIDKYLTTSKLAAQGFVVPETCVCQTWKAAMAAFETLGGDVVVKPIFGGEGRGLLRVQTEELAETTFKTLERIGSIIYLQKFIPHEGHDIRALVIGDKTWGVKRSNPSDWRTNVSRGGLAEPYSLGPEIEAIARQALNCLGLQMAGVDLLPGTDGKLYLLEVNAVPGWKATAKACETDVASEVLKYLSSLVNKRNSN